MKLQTKKIVVVAVVVLLILSFMLPMLPIFLEQ